MSNSPAHSSIIPLLPQTNSATLFHTKDDGNGGHTMAASSPNENVGCQNPRCQKNLAKGDNGILGNKLRRDACCVRIDWVPPMSSGAVGMIAAISSTSSTTSRRSGLGFINFNAYPRFTPRTSPPPTPTQYHVTQYSYH